MDQIYLPRLSRANKVIIILTVALFLANTIASQFAGFSLIPFLGLSYQGMLSGNFFQVLTYPFLGTGLFEVVLNCLMLWLMGSEFEINWGIKKYLIFLTSVILGAGILMLLISGVTQSSALQSFSLTGLSGVVTSLCVAYAFLYPDRIFSFMMVIPVKAKFFCLILAAISFYQGFFTTYGAGAWSQLGAMGMGFLYMWLTTKNSKKRISRDGQAMDYWSKRKKSKANLSIVRDDGEKQNNDDKPKYWH